MRMMCLGMLRKRPMSYSRSVFINTYGANDSNIGESNALMRGLQCGRNMRAFTHTDVYDKWNYIFPERNADYGTSSWEVLGLRFLYGMIYTKYQRMLQTEKHFDSLVDMFGYCILALIYCEEAGYSYMNVQPRVIAPEAQGALINEGMIYFWLNDKVGGTRAVQFFIDCIYTFTKEL